eukprot:TRINITY_DN6101_c0_g3_i1.p1 TRINITY_DN6101_c0_g3~~TRINITY_DN6101_c0_g3_i1.p1  ORF type:complete len:826 (+),score=110.17 TRINITY_DN6101_c0_g3_i1:68-2545(+)
MQGSIDNVESSQACNGLSGSAATILATYRQKCEAEVNRFLFAQLEATETLLKSLQFQEPPKAAEVWLASQASTSQAEELDAPSYRLVDVAKSHATPTATNEEVERLLPQEAPELLPACQAITSEASQLFHPEGEKSAEKMAGRSNDDIQSQPEVVGTSPNHVDSHGLDCATLEVSSDTVSSSSDGVANNIRKSFSHRRRQEQHMSAHMRRSNSSDNTDLSAVEAAENLHLVCKTTRTSTIQVAIEWMLGTVRGMDASVVQKISSDIDRRLTSIHKGPLLELVESHTFQVISFSVLVLNTLFILDGLNVSMNIACGRSPGGVIDWTSTSVADAIEYAFLGFLTLEVLLRLAAHRLRFIFTCEDKVWNLLDLILVAVSLVALAISLSADKAHDSERKGALAMRSARLFKVTRMVRIIRTARFFKQLDVFVSIILSCLSNLMWAMMTIMLLLVLFSVYFVYSLETWMVEFSSSDAAEDMQHVAILIRRHFGSVASSMLTLISAMSGGRDWEEVYDIFRRTGFVDTVIFLSMLAFFQVAVWNIVTSVFIENTFKTAVVDLEDQALVQRQRDRQDTNEFYDLCQRADLDKSETISLEEFEELLSREHIKHFFAAKALDITNATSFFRIMRAVTGVDEVHMDDVVGTCLRLKGNATSFDLQMLALEHKQLAKKTRAFIPVVQAELAVVARKVELILVALKAQQEDVAPARRTSDRDTSLPDPPKVDAVPARRTSFRDTSLPDPPKVDAVPARRTSFRDTSLPDPPKARSSALRRPGCLRVSPRSPQVSLSDNKVPSPRVTFSDNDVTMVDDNEMFIDENVGVGKRLTSTKL